MLTLMPDFMGMSDLGRKAPGTLMCRTLLGVSDGAGLACIFTVMKFRSTPRLTCQFMCGYKSLELPSLEVSGVHTVLSDLSGAGTPA